MAKSVLETVLHYKEMEETVPNSSMLREVKWQYADMASGGDGGEAAYCGDPIEVDESGDGVRWQSIRDYNYPGQSDSFFQEVCALMGWSW